MAYLPNDDNRKFTELFNVQRLKSSFVAKDSQVCISTIQRMYALLKDESLDEVAEETNPAEVMVRPKQPLPIVYNKKIPPEFFDFIIIDECHWLDLQCVAAGDRVLRRVSDRPDGNTGQSDLRLFPKERRQRVQP